MAQASHRTAPPARSADASGLNAIALGELRFAPPPAFRCDEQMVSYVSRKDPADKKATSLLLRQKDVRDGSDLATLAGEALADLAQSVKGISHISRAEIEFDDGAPDILFAYEFASRGREVVRQFYALRLDGQKLTSITLSAEKSELDDETAARFLDAIGSLQRAA